MTIDEWIKLITALASLAAMVIGLINRRQIRDVHISINSRMDELLKASKAASHAEGMQDQRDREKPIPAADNPSIDKPSPDTSNN